MSLKNRFQVDQDGRLREVAVSESMARLKEMFPDVDADALETQVMLERSHRLLATAREAQWSQYGLTGSRFILLRLLYTSAFMRLTMGEIAAQMNLGPNSVTQLVDAMAEGGLVERQPADNDRRVIYTSLTEKGRNLFELVLPETASRIAQAMAPLTEDERDTLRHLLAKIRMHLLADEALIEEDHSSDQSRVKSAKKGGRAG